MSSTLMFTAPEGGKFKKLSTFPNSWGGAYRVWDSLCKKYLGKEVYTIYKDMQSLWDLWKNPRLMCCESTVLLSTFDRAVVLRPDFPEMAKAFDDFDHENPVPSGHANHLPAMAGVLRGLPPEHHAVAWQQTTVAECHWIVNIGEDEDRPYDLSIDVDHFNVFDLREDDP